jgi:hypothetical protein
MLEEEGKARAEEIARSLWQGDLLATPTGVVLEARESSLREGAGDLEPIDEEGVWGVGAVQITSGWAAIVSQTCDVVRGLDDVAHLQLMPVVDLSEEEWNGALNGRHGTLFSLPPTGRLPLSFPAIDCAISFPVSKAALADGRVQVLSAPLDPAARVLLSNWLMRRVGRHAFPDELEHYVLGPLRDKVDKAMGKNSQGGFLANSLVGVWSSTEWAPAASIIFVVDPNRLAAQGKDVDLDKAADELLAPARKKLGKNEQSVQITHTVRTLDAVSAFTLFVEHRQVDLGALPVGQFVANNTIAALGASASPREGS